MTYAEPVSRPLLFRTSVYRAKVDYGPVPLLEATRSVLQVPKPPSAERVLGDGKGEAVSDQGQWQVAGNAAETYQRALVPAVFAAWAPLVVALADPRPGERVLDITCGTGVVARLAAQR